MFQSGNLVRCINEDMHVFNCVGLIHNAYEKMCSVAFGKEELLIRNEDMEKIADGAL